MASTGIPVGKFKEVFDAGKQAQMAKREPVRVAIELAPGVPQELAEALKQAFVPQTSHGLVHVGVLEPGKPIVVNPEADVCIVVCGDQPGLVASCARGWLGRGVPTCIVAQSSTEVPELGFTGGLTCGSAIGLDPARALDRLAGWLLSATDKDLAVAVNFPFCRRTLAERQVCSCAAANAGVGAVELIKGADFPVMFATESSMMAYIATAYDYPLGPSRVPELAAIALGGMAMRGLARRGSHLLPRLSWLVRGGIGWGGTYLTGQALIARYEMGEAFDERVAWVIDRVKEVASAIKERAATLTGRYVEVEPGATYMQPSLPGLAIEPVEVVDVPAGRGRTGWFEVNDGRALEA